MPVPVEPIPLVPVPSLPTGQFTSSQGVQATLYNEAGLVRQVVRNEVTIATAAAGDATHQIPANSAVIGLSVQTTGGITLGGGATHVGIGILGDLDLFGEFAIAGLASAGNTVYSALRPVTPVFRAAATTITVGSTTTGGVAAGTMTGTLRIQLTIETYQPLA